ncbi:unnamed protein product [Urochloa humidicola]
MGPTCQPQQSSPLPLSLPHTPRAAALARLPGRERLSPAPRNRHGRRRSARSVKDLDSRRRHPHPEFPTRQHSRRRESRGPEEQDDGDSSIQRREWGKGERNGRRNKEGAALPGRAGAGNRRRDREGSPRRPTRLSPAQPRS